jgi:hypothetical protein
VNRGAAAVGFSIVVVARHHVIGVIVGRIATVIVVIAVSVVVRIHRRHVVRVTWAMTWRWWHRRTIAIVVEAEVARTVVVADAWSNLDHYPRLVAIAAPAEANRLEVLESGEAVEFTSQFVVRHHRVCP